jgi:ubiquinone/menaquinone biosynthesis C-methylase UbiE
MYSLNCFFSTNSVRGLQMNDVQENKRFVTGHYLKRIAKGQGKKVKQASRKLMAIQEDSRVLDVGCGPATDTIAFSKLIGAGGCIVGVDRDRQMVEEANAELKKCRLSQSVYHVVGDAQSLPFRDGEFDRVHAERLFQVLPESVDSGRVFSEMQRVLKVGGIIVVADTDWASASVNFSDFALERRLIDFFVTRMRPNGFAGRQLLEMLKSKDYEEIKLEVLPVVTRDFKQTPFGNWLTTEATKTGTANEEEMIQWRRELEEKTAQNRFLSHVNMVIVAGRKK